MATFSLKLPDDLEGKQKSLLVEKSYLAGTDGNPVPTQREFKDPILGLRQHGDEAVRAVTPWWLNSRGMIASSTATLMNREAPYPLVKELARGKLNQIRGMVAEWESRGLEITPTVRSSILGAGKKLAEVVGLAPRDARFDACSSAALESAFGAATDLIGCYCEKLIAAKQRQTPQLPTTQSFYLRKTLPNSDQEKELCRAFNGVQISVPWRLVEPEPGKFDWVKLDEMVAWGRDRGLRVGLGPVVDLNSSDLPSWFFPIAKDINKAAGVIFRYIDQVVSRVRGKVDTFLVIQGGNFTDAQMGDLDETEWLRLTFNACLRVRQSLPEMPLGVGIVQPWGELLASEHRDHNPFLFAEALSRSVDGLGSIDIEMVFGQEGRGSVPRDALEISKMLDQIAYMGTSMRLDFAPPPLGLGLTPEGRLAWVREFYELALASPIVTEVRWCETFEGERDIFPGAGLLADPNHVHGKQTGEILEFLAGLKAKYLR